jgi:hypothetical protein
MSRKQIQALVYLAASLLVWPWLACGQVVINEVLVKNNATIGNSAGFVTYVELYNLGTSAVSLEGWSLTDATNNPTKFIFPAETTIPANGFILVWCDKAVLEPGFHANFKLDDTSDDLGLFDHARLVDYVAFGLQIADRPICRIPNGTGPWKLGLPTPANTNLPIAMGTTFALSINEWMAANSGGDDWLELYNPATNGPVSLGGLVLANTTNAARTARPIPELSFIGSGGFVRFWADDLAKKDASHLECKLSKSGDAIVLCEMGGNPVIDWVSFGPQTTDVSMGRLPDGGTNIFLFPLGASSPEHSNFLPLTNVVINELLAHTDPPLEDAVELFNPTATPVDISDYWLSNDQNDPRKYRIPTNTIIPARGFKVFYEYTSWNRSRTGNYPKFTFNAAHGDHVTLCSGNSLGNLTGYRAIENFGGSLNGISFGRYVRSDGGADFVPMSDLSFGTAVRASSPDTPQNRLVFESGPGAPNPYPKVGPVVISEIMYHPPDELIGTNWVDNTWAEFIELHNFSSNAVPLYDPAYPTNTWRLRDAVDFDFPPGTVIPAGGYLAVVSFDPGIDPFRLADFCSRYHVTPNNALVGPYQGKLANNGDSIELRKPDHPNVTEVPYVLVERLDYLASAAWTKLADGDGLSLHRLAPGGYANNYTNWIGAAPTLLKAKPSLLINEILPLAIPPLEAGIEIANPTAASMDIGNWWLSNDHLEPKKYRIPTNTFIPAFGFKVFYESDFNPDGSGQSPSFSLNSAHGGEVILASADADGNLTGYWLAESYGPTEAGVSMGRPVNSDGQDGLVPMSEPTLGTTNSDPLIGPVVISEIMFHPPDVLTYSNLVPVWMDNTDDEYIELQNLTTNTVPLYSTATNAPRQFTNTWRIRNEVEFDFPLFVSLPPTGRLLIVNFNPTANPAQQLQFREKFQVPAEVRLFGPLIGALKNRSGTIELYQPGPVQTPPHPDAGYVPYRLVEKVSYEDRAPWPTNTDGTGYSLQRLTAAAYADDPGNWFGTQPTGGRQAPPATRMIQEPPTSLTVAQGSSVTLTAVVEGVGTLSYQWYCNGLPLTNATTNWLNLANVQPTDEGFYQLVASSAFGMATSTVTQLIVALSPALLVPPTSQMVIQGEPLQLSATVSGTPAFGFKWGRLNPPPGIILATHITNGFTDTFLVPTGLLSDAGVYRVIITNQASTGGITSSLACVTVVQPLGDRMVLAGSTITLRTKIAAFGSRFYQWQFNGAEIPGANLGELSLTNVQPEQSGTYTMLIGTNSSFSGMVASVSGRLTVQTAATAPVIERQPTSWRAIPGAKALLRVTATGTDPLNYQWWHDQTNLISPGTNSFLEFTNVATTDLGTYVVVVSNSMGAVTSLVARLMDHDDKTLTPEFAGIGSTSAQVVTFWFSTVEGFSYQVEYKNTLTATAWTPLGPPHAGNGQPVVINDPMEIVSQRFYRVVLQP